MKTIKQIAIVVLILAVGSFVQARSRSEVIEPSRTEVVEPIHKRSLREIDGKNKFGMRSQGGNPRKVDDLLIFDGSMDGGRQVDPQIVVNKKYVFHATNSGFVVYDKRGKIVDGVGNHGFNDGIDPKLFYCVNNEVFGLDIWPYWNKPDKPVNIAISERDDPTRAWNVYPVSVPKCVDGGGLGCSKKWIGYSFPGGDERTFVLKMAEAKEGDPATIYHFRGSFGQPVLTQDDEEDLYFLRIDGPYLVITKVTDKGDGTPVAEEVAREEHDLEYVGQPPKSPQKGTDQVTSSGDRNPKNVILQGGFLWFSHAVNCRGRSAVQWHQVELDGDIKQTGIIKSRDSNYIQTTIGVNKDLDVLVGFQEVNEDMYISPRLAYRKARDGKGKLRPMISLGEGKGPTDGVAWGDYSGCAVDAGNMLDLWTVQSIADRSGSGDTVIAKVPLSRIKR